jgi:lipid-A-disaccharide synthase
MKFLVSAGEASSDLYAAQLIVALRRRARADDEPVEFMGVGGERMRAAGCDTIVDARHLAVVGMTEILSHLPRIYLGFRRLLAAVDGAAVKPDAAIVVDSPAFNFRVARAMHARGIPVIYFVAPQLWAWRSYRVRRVQRWVKKVLCIFPFEEEFYRQHGVDVEYVGHPLAGLPPPQISREEYAAKHGLDPGRTWIALLPGSRRKEFKFHFATMMEAARKLRQESGDEFQFIVPLTSATAGGRGKESRSGSADSDGSHSRGDPRGNAGRTSGGDFRIGSGAAFVDQAGPALLHARAAVVASGTATVEAALLGTPFVAVYRLSSFSFFAARRLVKVPHVAMPNLIAGREVVPELLQRDFSAENVVRCLREILPEGAPRERMLAGLGAVQQKLQFPRQNKGVTTAIERAADAIMRSLATPAERVQR